MLALRYHEARCQKDRAAAEATACVISSRSGVAAHAGTRCRSSISAGTLSRRNASVFGQSALLPKPSAVRWYSVIVDSGPPLKTVTMATFWPSSRSEWIRPPQERATSSGWGATKTWVTSEEDSIAASTRGDASALEAVAPDERDEDDRLERRLDQPL